MRIVTHLENIEIPDTVRTIGKFAFNNAAIRSIKIPYGVTTITCGAFDSCSNLTEVIIPDTVKTIGSQAFWSYKKLKKLEIPSSVENVSALVFANCSSLKEIYFYSKNITISEDTFVNYTPDYIYAYENTTVGEYAKQNFKPLTYIPIKNLDITALKTNKASGTELGKTIKVQASAEGTGEIKYKFTVMKDGKVVSSRGYSTKNYMNWKPSEAGDYKIICSVKDKCNGLKKSVIDYKVSKKLEINNCNAVKKASDERIVNLEMNASWKPNKSGSYNIYFKAKDEKGNEVTNVMGYTVD